MPSVDTGRLPYSALEKYNDRVHIPDDKVLYFGNDGDVSFLFSSSDAHLQIRGDTNFPHTQTRSAVAVAGATGVAANLVIPVTHGIVAKTTNVAGGEALTLANGTDGQMLLIYLAADGGTGTLTPATKTGFATIAFADVGDSALLYFVNSTIGWIILGVWGKSAPPVLT